MTEAMVSSPFSFVCLLVLIGRRLLQIFRIGCRDSWIWSIVDDLLWLGGHPNVISCMMDDVAYGFANPAWSVPVVERVFFRSWLVGNYIMELGEMESG